ncbi:Glutamate--tRNA ligase [Trichinella pseudospiralis]
MFSLNGTHSSPVKELNSPVIQFVQHEQSLGVLPKAMLCAVGIAELKPQGEEKKQKGQSARPSNTIQLIEEYEEDYRNRDPWHG